MILQGFSMCTCRTTERCQPARAAEGPLAIAPDPELPVELVSGANQASLPSFPGDYRMLRLLNTSLFSAASLNCNLNIRGGREERTIGTESIAIDKTVP